MGQTLYSVDTFLPCDADGLVEGQMRCGEHTDFCSMTLLIQDENGGLEVSTRNN